MASFTNQRRKKMANFGVVVNGIVENIVVADSKELAEMATGKPCFEYTAEKPAFVGLGHDGKEFEQPEIVSIIFEEPITSEETILEIEE
jgi:hypothetical protein